MGLVSGHVTSGASHPCCDWWKPVRLAAKPKKRSTATHILSPLLPLSFAFTISDKSQSFHFFDHVDHRFLVVFVFREVLSDVVPVKAGVSSDNS
jgi:hypothetical protein